MSTKNVYAALSSALQAHINCCEGHGTEEWAQRWENVIEYIMKHHFPSGSGFDEGTSFDWERSTPQTLVFKTSFHHMNENGYYDGWTVHLVRVRPCFDGVSITISGKDRNFIKELIADRFYQLVSDEIDVSELLQGECK